MEREKFMQEARLTAHKILEGKENGIMNLVQQAWAEGKRNAEVETLRAAIDEALDRRDLPTTMEELAAEHPEPVYPTWVEYLAAIGVIPHGIRFGTTDALLCEYLLKSIPTDIAQKLGIEPKE